MPGGFPRPRIGERKSMLVAAAVAGTGLMLCLVNLGHGGLSLVVFGSGVLMLGAASSVYTLARQSYLTEIVPPEMRARALSTLGGKQAASQTTSPAITADPGRQQTAGAGRLVPGLGATAHCGSPPRPHKGDHSA